MVSNILLAEIAPADVYAQVQELKEMVSFQQWTVIILAVLVVCQLVAKVIIFTEVFKTNRETKGLISDTKKLLTMVEGHGVVSDAVIRRMAREIKDHFQEAVRPVPEKTAQKVVEAITPGDGKSGTGSGLTNVAQSQPVPAPQEGQ